MIFCTRQLQAKSLEQQQPVMFIFRDLKKAFDKVPRPAMWAVLARFGCPPDFVTLVRGLHDGMVGRTTKKSLIEKQYADDNATPGQTAEDLQRTAITYNTVYERFGMQVNTDKTKVLIQHPPDVENRIRAAHSAYGRLSCRVFNNHALTMATKIMVFQAIVLSTLLYACEIWTLYRSEIQSLECFQQYKLRQILKIPWNSHTTNVAVLNQASITSVEANIIRHRLRWAGHVQRMEPSRLPKIMLYGELANGTRQREAPKLLYKDQLKRTLALTNIDPSSWEQTARVRAT
ncbi:hypothetical protein Pmani_024556 [Petrolisthes manimaculis]|uniref:Reverse transcriptase domain-containing protein n=1 Tax=Petrolisthes manimaculis TaxID=1843537 RepID=A0AAE1P8Y3_9EUCA|nr:hypothetical protein Pmani_024556 [Petrolisthes manimaculis]